MSIDKKTSKISQFTGNNPADKGLIGRLIKDNKAPKTRGDNPADLGAVAQVLRRNIRNGNDYENIIRALPSLKLPISIIVSSIISPGDLVKQEVLINSKMQGVDSTLLSQLDKPIIRHFIEEMQIQTQLPTWVEEAYVTRGAHPMLIIPESALDKMMKTGNYSEESYKSLNEKQGLWYKSKGLLGTPRTVSYSQEVLSMESQFHEVDDNLLKHSIEIPPKLRRKDSTQFLPYHVTDNPSVLREPARLAMRSHRTKKSVYGSPAFESEIKKRGGGKERTAEQIYASYFKTATSKHKRLIVMPTTKREDNEGLGHPLLYHLPPECVVSAFVPGQPNEPSGYFVALDQSGYPASYLSRLNYYDDIRTAWVENGTGNQQAGSLLAQAKDISSGAIPDYSDSDIDRQIRMNADIIERDLVARIASGEADPATQIGMTDSFNKMMFARFARNQSTTLLYVPADYMVYLAFDYTPFGVGKSVFEDLKELAAATVAIKVANTIQALKNAIPGKDLNITLDPDDKNAEETIVESIREALLLQFHHMPTNISTTADVATQIQQSALNVNIEGNEYYPSMKSSIAERERVNTSPDTALYDSNIDELNNALGVPSELVNGINQPEFATTAVQQNLLLRKRVIEAQALVNPAITDLIRIYTMHSGPLCADLLEIIESNKKLLPKEYEGDVGGFLVDYINSITGRLPEPIVDDMEHKSDLIEKFTTALDKILPGWVASELFTEYDPETYKTQIEQMTTSIRSLVLRSWIRKHGIMPELDIFTSDVDGNLVFSGADEAINHNDMLNKAMARWIEDQAKRSKSRSSSDRRALKEDASAKENTDKVSQIASADNEGLGEGSDGQEEVTESVDDTSEPSDDTDTDTDTDDDADADADVGNEDEGDDLNLDDLT